MGRNRRLVESPVKHHISDVIRDQGEIIDVYDVGSEVVLGENCPPPITRRET